MTRPTKRALFLILWMGLFPDGAANQRGAYGGDFTMPVEPSRL